MTDNIFFFFNDTATTEIYTLSLHDALPISPPFYASAVYLRQTSGILVVYRRFKRPSGGRYEDYQELPRNHSRAERVVHRRSLHRHHRDTIRALPPGGRERPLHPRRPNGVAHPPAWADHLRHRGLRPLPAPRLPRRGD